jgi:hypothetical protein
MMKRSLIALVFCALILSACASKAAAPTSSPGMSYSSSGPVVAPAAPAEASGGVSSSNGNPFAVSQKSSADSSTTSIDTGSKQPQQQQTRVVIRTAQMSIVVADPLKAVDAITKMAADNGGFIVSSNTYKVSLEDGGQAPEASITIRVKAESLDAVMAEIRKLVKNADQDILTENVTGEDVTKDYTDLQSRLKNLQDAEAQLREMMASATKPEDVLNIFNQLTQVREQIEVLQGQINYYNEAAALSSIAVTIKAEASVKPLTIGSWQPAGVARDALQATVNGLKGVATAAIWLVLTVLPIGVAILLPIYLFIRLIIWLFRRNKPRKAAVPPAAPPPAQA